MNTEWKPIESAPKDELILVGPTKRMGICVAMNHSRDGWVTETCNEWCSIYTPTHWMPLPAEPCLTCNGHGMIGGLTPHSGYDAEPCPDCSPPAPTSMADEMTEGRHITKIDRAEFESITKPLIKWLNENGHPHTCIVVRTDGAEFLEGQIGYQNDEFIRG